jgi:hypothetical protein
LGLPKPRRCAFSDRPFGNPSAPAISASKLAEHFSETEKRRRMRGRKPQRVGQRHTEQAELVAEDVREGYVSRAVAQNTYGVVLTVAGDVDVYATKLRRERQGPVRAEEEDFEVIPG